jgi:hypothetical protein
MRCATIAFSGWSSFSFAMRAAVPWEYGFMMSLNRVSASREMSAMS